MNRAAFYDHLRKRNSGVFGSSLSQRQVTATEAILDEGAHLPLSHLAHVLGEVYHETGGGMYPVKETVMPWHKDQNPPDATVIARLNVAWAKGQMPGVKSPYWTEGWFGRGGIQPTHLGNYANLTPLVGVDLIANPDLALDPVISARIAVKGCEHGVFRKHKLADFDGPNGYDHVGARNIVNGDVSRNGGKVAGYARAFEAALEASGYRPRATQSPAEPPSAPAHDGIPDRKEGLWTALLRFLRGFFKGDTA